MIRQLLLPISLLIVISSNAQKVNYPPAPASVYISYKQEVKPTQKATLWSDDVSVGANWNFTNASTPILDWSIQTDSTVVSTSGPFQSGSTLNGFLVFKSDTSTGAVADAYAEYVGAPIDLTGFPNVRIQFEQQFISDSNQRILEVSQDGISWSPFVISDGISPTGVKHNDLTSVDISSVAGNAGNLHFRFHFSGTQEGYWAIDDLQLQSIDSVDLRAVRVDWGTTGAWGVRMPYYSVVSMQLSPIEFCLVAANDGLLDQDTVMYSVSIPSEGFISLDTFSIQSGETDTLCPQGVFVPSSTTSVHQADYQLQSISSEINTLNNSIESTQFEVLDGNWIPYARDDFFHGIQGGIKAFGGPGDGWKVGNVFDVFHDDYCVVMEVVFHPSAPVGEEVFGQLYLFDTLLNEFILMDQTYSSIQPSDLGNAKVMPFYSGTQLSAGSSYLVTIGMYNSSNSGGVVATAGTSKPNTSFLIDEGTQEFYYLTETPMVRLVFYPEGLEENQSDFNLSIYPNPTNKVTTVSFDLPSNSPVNFSIVDVSGKKIEQTESIFYQEGKNQYELNTSALLNGVYFVTFASDFGSTTKRIIVQH
ncbi:MAG: T9SS type A sorting domain-containing protein [Flavobacteriales bacterium]|nr:T9SS type A sorting domain-containing protein [Flavobacteriales bacterium]